MNLYKRGEGPLYSFYTPYHLCHFEVPTSLARVGAVRGRGAGPDRRADRRRRRDREGRPPTPARRSTASASYMTYGQCENSDVTLAERLLPMGLAEGCRLVRDVPRDQVLTYADVELPAGRLADELRAEQDATFGSAASV